MENREKGRIMKKVVKVASPPSIWTEGKNRRRMLCDEPVVGGAEPPENESSRDLVYIVILTR